MQLTGCGTALVTPFRNDAVDEAALAALIEEQIAGGVRLLIPCGTTGEAATLNEEEQICVIERTIATAAGRVLIFAGCTLNSTREAVSRAQRFAKIPGLSGLLTANPYYNRPGQEGQYQHFRAIAEAVAPLPVLLYNIPGRTGTNLEPGTVRRLTEIPNIVGIKESSGNIAQITELLRNVPKTFRVFAGDDNLALPIIELGGAGLISVASNVVPQQMAELVTAALAGDRTRAAELNARWLPLIQAHFWEPSPAPVKAVLSLLGRTTDEVRLPIIPVTPATRLRLQALLNDLGLQAK